MSTRQIHIFISHAWAYSGHYNTLAEWVFKNNWSTGQASLDFRDYSVPKNDPIHNVDSEKQLKNAIYAKIVRSHVIVIPTGMYANYSNWIQKEIDGANIYQKPILAVKLWRAKRTSSVVGSAAQKNVEWNKDAVINGIWSLYKESDKTIFDLYKDSESTIFKDV